MLSIGVLALAEAALVLSVKTFARAWGMPLDRGAFVPVDYLSPVVLTFVPCTMTVHSEVLLLGTLYGVSA